MFPISTRRRALAALGLLALACTVQPVTASAETIMVFFDAGKAEPPPSAKPLVALIAKIAKPGGRISIAGHCDTAEKDPAKLSLARAMALQKAIVDAGAPDGITYTLVGKAATAGMVPTKPNVKEPQNRFAAVTID